jgi:hypothetical protein
MLKNDQVDVMNRVSSIIYNSVPPYESIGWPPQISEYMKRLTEDVAREIIYSIYSENELDKKVDGIILNEP